jgi:hypothetical protein
MLRKTTTGQVLIRDLTCARERRGFPRRLQVLSDLQIQRSQLPLEGAVEDGGHEGVEFGCGLGV